VSRSSCRQGEGLAQHRFGLKPDSQGKLAVF
jgi:hypothetical protein